MKIGTFTGVTQTGTQKITKGFGVMLLRLDFNPQNLAAETIHMWIERANGKNIDIAKEGTTLGHFVSLYTHGEGAITSRGGLYYIQCPISEGNIVLGEGDTVKLEVSGLDATKVYDIFAMEVPVYSNTISYIETRTMSSDEKERTYSTENFDLMLLTNMTKIRYIEYVGSNGVSYKHTVEEVIAAGHDVDHIALIDGTAIHQELDTDNLIVSLVGVRQFTITKITGTVDMVMLNRFDNDVAPDSPMG